MVCYISKLPSSAVRDWIKQLENAHLTTMGNKLTFETYLVVVKLSVWVVLKKMCMGLYTTFEVGCIASALPTEHLAWWLRVLEVGGPVV